MAFSGESQVLLSTEILIQPSGPEWWRESGHFNKVNTMSEPLPESGLDFLVLSREQALALNKFLKNQYLHYDEESLHDAARKVMEFSDRVNDANNSGN